MLKINQTKKWEYRFAQQRKNILFVCTGNTCRSPMAERLLRNALGENASVSSAGLKDQPGKPASPHAIQVMQENNIDISDHRSRTLTAEMASAADIVFVMSEDAIAKIKQIAPNANVKLLSEAGFSNPYGGDVNTYRQTYKDLSNAISQHNL